MREKIKIAIGGGNPKIELYMKGALPEADVDPEITVHKAVGELIDNTTGELCGELDKIYRYPYGYVVRSSNVGKMEKYREKERWVGDEIEQKKRLGELPQNLFVIGDTKSLKLLLVYLEKPCPFL